MCINIIIVTVIAAIIVIVANYFEFMFTFYIVFGLGRANWWNVETVQAKLIYTQNIFNTSDNEVNEHKYVETAFLILFPLIWYF